MSRETDINCELFLQNGLLLWEKGVQRALCTSNNCYDTEITAFAKYEVVSSVRKEMKLLIEKKDVVSSVNVSVVLQED